MYKLLFDIIIIIVDSITLWHRVIPTPFHFERTLFRINKQNLVQVKIQKLRFVSDVHSMKHCLKSIKTKYLL